MSDTIRDQYTDPTPLGHGGETVLVIRDGTLELKEKPAEERPQIKGAHKFAVDHAGDEMIERTTETTLGIYYRLGNKITVRGSGNGGHWLCLTCTGRDRYELGDHEGCVHIQRVKRWAADHPKEAAA